MKYKVGDFILIEELDKKAGWGEKFIGKVGKIIEINIIYKNNGKEQIEYKTRFRLDNGKFWDVEIYPDLDTFEKSSYEEYIASII